VSEKTIALNIEGLKKVYKNGVEAVKGIDLQVQQGDFFALLGPNGQVNQPLLVLSHR
jgi:ABC-2 type transport system ATP-binding protein